MPYAMRYDDSTWVVHHFGEEGSGIGGPLQVFAKLKEECLEKKESFCDPAFPPYDIQCLDTPVTWLRPKDIVANAEFITNGMSRFDINQGALGNCWLLAALADITTREKEMAITVPKNNSGFDEDSGYCGIFHFRFWHDGVWIDISIDDRLPTQDNKLRFLRSNDENEFWPALLEKAYAKMYGGYENLQGGLMNEGLQDLTAGITSHMRLLAFDPVSTFKRMYDAVNHHNSFIAAGILKLNLDDRSILPNGLVIGHAYSVIKMNLVNAKFDEDKGAIRRVPLISLRNPWGRVEWNGDWSDQSELWKNVAAITRKKLQQKDREDGEFWMSFGDFVTNFNLVEMCSTRYPASFPGLHRIHGVDWEVLTYHGEWIRGTNAGGCRTFEDSFFTNPKYQFCVESILGRKNLKRRVTVALLHKGRRALRAIQQPPLKFGFVIYKIEESDRKMPLDKEFFDSHSSYQSCPEYDFFRENSMEFDADPGNYIVVPCTQKPDEEGKFFLRIMVELDDSDLYHMVTKEKQGLESQFPDSQVWNPDLNQCESSIQREEFDQWLQSMMMAGAGNLTIEPMTNNEPEVQFEENDNQEPDEEPQRPKKLCLSLEQ